MSISHVKSNAVPDFTGTVTLFNSAGVTTTGLASALVRPSDWNSAHAMLLTIGGNTAGQSTHSGTNLELHGGNNVTLSLNGNTLSFNAPSQSVQTQGSVAVLGSTGAISFANSNGLTFGGNASTITASHNGITSQTVQTQGSVAVQGSTGAISFANSNGITFGGNASTMTASHNGLTSQSNQAVSAGNGSSAFQTLSFADSNGVSWSTQAGGIGATVRTDYASSNHSHGNPTLALTNLSGSTASNSAGLTISLSAAAPGGGGGPAISAGGASASNGTIVFSNSNGVSFGMNGSTITATVTPGAAAGLAAASAGTQQATSGTLVFANSNGLTFGMSGSSQVTASHNGITSQTVQTQSNVQGISAGTQVGRTGDIVFANSNGLTFGMSGSSQVTASYNSTQFAGTGTSVTGNASITLNSNGLQFNGSGLAGVSTGFTGANLSASITHNSSGIAISMSAAAPAAGAGLSAGTQSVNTGTVAFANSNGITFGMSGSNQITASHNGITSQSVQTLGIYASSNTTGASSSSTYDARSLSMQGVGGVSVGWSNGSLQISGPALTSLSVTGALSASSNGSTISLGVGTVTVTAASNTTQASSGTINLAGPVFAGAGGVSVGVSNGSIVISGGSGGGGGAGISAGTQSVSTGTVAFANSNGITFGMSGSNQVTASYNSTQFAGTGTTFAGANASASMTLNSAGLNLSFSVAAPGGGGAAISAAGSSQNAGTIVFSNSNGISFGMNGSTITATVTPGAAAGIAAMNNSNTTYSSGTVQLTEGGGAITIASGTGQRFAFSVPQTSSMVGASGISISTNGSTVSIYQPAVSYYANIDYLNVSQSQTVGQSTSVVFPFNIRENVSAGFLRMAHTVSIASTSFASTATTQYSYQQAETHNVVLYSMGTGASSLSLQSIFSTSVGVTMSINVSRNSTNNISVTHGLSFPVSGGTSSLSFSYAATNSTDQISTTHMTALSGMKVWDTSFATSLPPGQFYMAYGFSSTQTTQQTAALSGARLVHSHIGVSMPNNTVGQFGVSNNASVMWISGVGSFTTAGGGTTASMGLSNVSSSASHVVPYIQMQRVG